jgi:putative nucleotidyltransferase-like protein
MWLGLEGFRLRAARGDVPSVSHWHDDAVQMGNPKEDASLWRDVDALIDRAPSDDDLRSHRLEELAAGRFRALGRPVPPDFAARERLAAIASMTAPVALERVRAAYGGLAIVIKGPEVAACYPDKMMRGFGDLDLLVPDAEAMQRALIDAGFELVGDPKLYVDIHHLRPVLAVGTPLPIELHTRPKWFGSSPPQLEELFEAAVPGTTGVEGMLTLPPEHHALLLAVHSWAHEPLRRMRDLVDVAAVLRGADRDEIQRLARAWRVQRLWATTLGVVDALFSDGRTSGALNLWAQNLRNMRERTVLESHLEHWISDFWALPIHSATMRLPATLLSEIRPGRDENWPTKLARSALAVRNAARRRSQHDQQLDARVAREPDRH